MERSRLDDCGCVFLVSYGASLDGRVLGAALLAVTPLVEGVW